jgi:hypothetical protein
MARALGMFWDQFTIYGGTRLAVEAPRSATAPASHPGSLIACDALPRQSPTAYIEGF